MENPNVNYLNMAKIVMETFEYCYADDSESITDLVKVEGIDSWITLSKGRLEECRETVLLCLSLLPHQFKSGYGWTFLNLGMTRENYTIWTDSVAVKEMLMLLAMGLRLMSYSFPRDKWKELYEQMPYVRIYL